MCIRKNVMKHIESNSSNQRFSIVREEIKNLLSIIMGSIEDAQDTQNFEYLQQNTTSEQDLEVLKELEKSSKELDKKAIEYQNSIGITSKPKVQNNRPKKQQVQESRTSTIIKPISQNKENNNRISRINNDFDREL